MPDKKITDLVDGTPLQPTDEFVVARAGDNFKIDGADIVSAATAAVTKHDVTISGNTAGVLAPISSGTWTLAGGNNITLSQVGNAVTISGANAGGAQTGISGIANSEVTYTSGTVSLSELGALTIRSSVGQIFQLEVPATSSLSATGIVNISTNGSTISIGASQSVQPETQTFIAGISASDTLYTSGNVRISGSQAVTVRSGTGQLVIVDAPAQTAQTQGIVNLGVSTGGNTSGDTTVNSGTRMVLVGSNNLTLSQGTAANATTITISGPNSSLLSATGIVSLSTNGGTISVGAPAYSAGISTNGNTAGDTGFASQRLALIGGNNITLSGSTNGGSMSLTISGGAGGVETQTAISGIANSQTTYTSGTVSLSELGAITIRSTTGNQFQLSVNSQSVQPETQTFIAGISASDTLYTSGNVRITGVGGGVTVSSNTGQRVDISVAAPVAATNLSVGVSTGGNTLGDTGVATGSRFVIVGSNGITASQGTAAGATTVTLSGVTQSVQTQGGFVSLGVSTGGNTAGNTQVSTGSRFVLVGLGEVSLSQATAAGASTVSISAPAQTVQTQGGFLSAGVSTGGNTAGNTQVSTGTRLVIVGSGMITASQGTAAGASTITLNATQSVQTNDIPRMGVSTGGNTSGDTTVNSGTRLVFVGSNNITLSQGTAASATTITISGPNVGGNFSAGMSTNGNTSGDTGYASQRLNLVGGNNITLSGSTNGGSMSLTISAPNLGAGAMSAGVSTGGNTAGATGITGTQLVLVGVSPMSLSQTTGANGGTVSFNAPATSSLSATGGIQISTNGSTISIGDGGRTLADIQNFPMAQAALMTHAASISKTPFYFPMSIGGPLIANSFVIRLSAVTTATLQSFSVHAGFYTMVNSTSMALLGSWSEAYVASTASSASWSGIRNYVMTGIGTHANLSRITGGDYVIGMMFSAGAAGSMAQSIMGAGSVNPVLGRIVPGTNQLSTGTSQGAMPLFGRGSTTVNALPANVVATELVNQGAGASAQLQPWIYIRS